MRRSMALACLLSLMAAEASAAWVNITTPVGTPIRLGVYGTANPDCSPGEKVTVRITESPQNGRAVVKKVAVFHQFSPHGLRSACSRRRVQGTEIRYFPSRGFVGVDRVAAEVFYPTGVTRSDTFTVKVR